MTNEAIDWSRYMEGLQGKANTDNTNLTGKADGVIDYQVNPDGSWYRQWKSGWLEQGGIVTGSGVSDNIDIKIKPYKDVNYFLNITRTSMIKGSGLSGEYWYLVREKKHNSFKMGADFDNQTNVAWYACGQGGV